MKKYDAILFDLDGTLLPMDNDLFIKTYLGLLVKKMAPSGYDKDLLVSSLWKGTGAMIKNDGSKTNAEVFWSYFEKVFGKRIYSDIATFDTFYENEFHAAASVTFPTDLAQIAVDLARENANKVILATNPFFPAVAVRSRLSWAKVAPESFDLITTYENSSFCKPNLEYYKSIVKALGVESCECLMVGNDVGEDMVASELGMKVFLISSCLINRKNQDISSYPSGDFVDLLNYVRSL